jgi:hypothetical protein
MLKTHLPRLESQDIVHIHNPKGLDQKQIYHRALRGQIKKEDKPLFNKHTTGKQKIHERKNKNKKTIKQEHTRRMTAAGRKSTACLKIDCSWKKN